MGDGQRREGLEQAAAAMDRGERQGFDPEEMRSCALELRRRARDEASR